MFYQSLHGEKESNGSAIMFDVTLNGDGIDEGKYSSVVSRANTVNVYPNPTKNKSTIFLNIKEECFLIIAVVDAIGRIIERVITKENRPAGEYSEYMDFGNYSSGVYFVETDINEEAYLNKVIVQKQ